jgi:hypothetical protein
MGRSLHAATVPMLADGATTFLPFVGNQRPAPLLTQPTIDADKTVYVAWASYGDGNVGGNANWQYGGWALAYNARTLAVRAV